MCAITRTGNHLVVPTKIYNPCWLLTILALGIQIIMLSNTVKTLFGNWADTDALVKAGNDIVYYSHTLGNCLYMIWKIWELPKFIVSCKRIETMCKKYQKTNDGLVRDCLLLFTFFASTQGFGNFLYYYAVGKFSK